jgi:hypothetical protein
MSAENSLSKLLSRTLDANLRYTAMATKLATSALDSAFSVAKELGPQLANFGQEVTGGTVQPQRKSTQPAPAAIVLEGVAGSVAVGFFVVENSLPREISTPVEVSALVAPDGREIQSALRFEPGKITLAAGEKVIARVSAKVSRRLVVGERYQGEIRVPDVAGARIPIVLRRKADVAAKKSARKKVGKPVASAPKRKSPARAKKTVGTTVRSRVK